MGRAHALGACGRGGDGGDTGLSLSRGWHRGTAAARRAAHAGRQRGVDYDYRDAAEGSGMIDLEKYRPRPGAPALTCRIVRGAYLCTQCLGEEQPTGGADAEVLY